MKASTITMFAIVIISGVLIGSIPITLKYKLNNNHYSQLHPDENYKFDRHHFRMTNKFVISDLDNCTIIPSDSFFIEIERLDCDAVKVFENGDTLTIGSVDPAEKAGQKVRIFVPSAGRIICRNSNVLLRGCIKMTGIPSFLFDLSNSRLSTESISDQWKAYQFIDQLEINGSDSSRVFFSGSIRINNLILNDVSSVSSGDHTNIDNLKVSYRKKKTFDSNGTSRKLDIQEF